jgi:hypothetical protein
MLLGGRLVPLTGQVLMLLTQLKINAGIRYLNKVTLVELNTLEKRRA